MIRENCGGNSLSEINGDYSLRQKMMKISDAQAQEAYYTHTVHTCLKFSGIEALSIPQRCQDFNMYAELLWVCLS